MNNRDLYNQIVQGFQEKSIRTYIGKDAENFLKSTGIAEETVNHFFKDLRKKWEGRAERLEQKHEAWLDRRIGKH